MRRGLIAGGTGRYPGKFNFRDREQLAEVSSRVADESECQHLHSEISRLEMWGPHLVVDGRGPFTATLAMARRLGDDGLLARALCLSARTELFWGALEAGAAYAEEAIATFGRLTEDQQLRLAGPHAQAWRVAGNTQMKLGSIADALPLLERAIGLAQAGVDAAVADESTFSAMPATSALICSINNLGMALISMREMTGAMEVLLRALDVIDAHPQTVDDVPDDIIYTVFNLVSILHQDARDRLAAGESAEAPLVQARTLLETRAAALVERRGAAGCRVSLLGEREYLEMSAQHLLLEGQLEAALEQFRKLADSSGEDRWRGAVGERGLAETLLALGRLTEALTHARTALAAYDQNEEIGERAQVLSVLSRVHRAMGQDREALDCLELNNRLRGRLDALAARQYAGHMAARLGLERARAEAEAQRRIASELQDLNNRLVEQAAALEAQTHALSLARSAAEEASRAKSAFLANMSHELRTPLNAILGFAEMMRDGYAGPPGPAWNGYAGMVHEAGTHLLAVIGEILDLSKIEAGRVMLSIEPVDLSGLFETCRELIEPMAEQGRIVLVLDCHPSLWEIPADPVRLKQILLNLLSNAVKFTPEGGRITLSAKPGSKGLVEIRVTDTGIGMTAAELQLALEIFGQIESEVARKHQGSGLGLPIAVGLAELHGGALTVQSEKGVGTVVTVTLPTSE
jgi:signal transduction histidine kinase